MKNTKKTFLIGAGILLFSGIVSKFLGAFYKIPLISILQSYGLGIYQMIYPIFALFVMLSSSGIVVALSKNVASVFYSKKKTNIYLKSAFLLVLILTGIFSIIFAIITPIFATRQGNSSFQICYFAIFPSIFLSGILAVFRGYFLGKNKMSVTAIATIFEQISKVSFSILFSKMLSNNGVIFAVGGAFLGITISEILTCFAYFIFFKKTKNFVKNVIKVSKNIQKLTKNTQIFKNMLTNQCFFSQKLTTKIALKKLFVTSFFVTVEASILPLVVALDGVFVVPLLIKNGINSQIAYSLFGISNGIVSSIISLPIFVSTSIGSAIIPNLQKNTLSQVAEKIKLSIKLVWIFSLAFVVLFSIVPKNIIEFLFAGGLSKDLIDEVYISGDLLKIGSFSTLYLSLLTITTSILQGIGKAKKPAINLLISAIFREFLLVFLIKFTNFGIYSIGLADVCFYGFALVLNIFSIKKLANFQLSYFKNFTLPTISAMIMCISIIFSKNLFEGLFSPKILTIAVCGIAGITYVFCLFVTKVISFSEIKNMIANKNGHSKI